MLSQIDLQIKNKFEKTVSNYKTAIKLMHQDEREYNPKVKCDSKHIQNESLKSFVHDLVQQSAFQDQDTANTSFYKLTN